MANDKSCKVHIRAYDVDNGRSDNVTVVLPANNNDNYNINNNINGNDNNDNAAEQPKIRDTRQSQTTTTDDASSDRKVQNLEIEKAGNKKVTLTWEEPANSDELINYAISYNCYIPGTRGATTHTIFTSISIDNLPTDNACKFFIIPIYGDSGSDSGSGDSITLNRPLKDIPFIETPNDIQLTAVMDGSDAIEVSWHPIYSDVSNYILQWNDGTNPGDGFMPHYEKVFQGDNRPTSQIIKNVIPGNTYTIVLTLLYQEHDYIASESSTIIKYTVS